MKEGGAGSPYKTKDKRVVTGNKTGNDQIIKWIEFNDMYKCIVITIQLHFQQFHY